MFYPETDNKAEAKRRLDKFFEDNGFSTGRMDKTAYYDSKEKQIKAKGRVAYLRDAGLTMRYEIQVDKDNPVNRLNLECKFEERTTGTYLIYYRISTTFCKGKYESRPPVNGRVTITELIQDLEDAINRKKEDWYC